ncbi:glycosyltransferase [Terrilactibacillus sp. BCM23-1]|uniref:Glycosyltransferase n=1 Tax=Terrilactibacillus tamarindi TaxID=2599694 RepID=A0A6N8CSX8_9BACI|nr:glycosyltransferase [Terrilactibacillus tamarindi]MTT32163.1 glycosyltransferase [Terrilactibacillus tamarindi]
MNNIAVLIPVYNNQEGLLLTLNSLVRETDAKLDVYVIDDGSKVPIKCTTIIGNHNIFVYRMAENSGIENALNYGLKIIQANGYRYIARIDAGDKILTNRFSKQCLYLKNNKDVALVGSYTDYKTKDGKLMFSFKPPMTYKKIKSRMHLNSCFSHPSVMFNSDVLNEIGNYSVNFKSAEDYEFFFRILSKYKVANINKVLLEQEYNSTGISATRRKQQLLSRFRIQIKYFKVTEINSYIGLIKTILLLFIPRKIVDLLKH